MNKKMSLASLIQQSMMGSLRWPIILIFFLVLLIYLIFHSFLNFSFQKTQYAEIAGYNLLETRQDAQVISVYLEQVNRQARHLQREQQQFFQQPGAYPLPHDPPKFSVHANGAFYKRVDNGGGSLYYSASTPIGPAQREKARQTEVLDTGLKAVVEDNPLVVQAYLNTWDDMNRLYPFMPNAPEQYGPAISMESYNFYYLAMPEHNPSRAPVWTRAYLDPAGQGWMVSCVVPVYSGDFLEGVTGLDITLGAFVQHLLSDREGSQVGTFLLDSQGTVLVMDAAVEQLLDLSEKKSHEYRQAVLSTVYKPDSYNLLSHQTLEIRTVFERMLEEQQPSVDVMIKGRRYFIAQAQISETGWRLFSINDGGALFHSLTELKHMSGGLMLAALVVILLLVGAFGWLIQARLTRLARRLSQPIVKLAETSAQLATGSDIVVLERSDVIEIDQLNRNFQSMLSELDNRTQKLIEEAATRVRTEQEAEQLRSFVVVDPLTGLYNRRKVDEVLEFEWQRIQRYGGGCALVMIDLDHFKRVNDHYGHLVGDEVLKALAKLLCRRVRKSDLAARWGGEEFLLICPDTVLEAAALMAEELRRSVVAYDFGFGERQSASFGVAYLDSGSRSVAEVLERVDQALYRAKNAGRNRVEVSEPAA